jgi:uncharacterized membrane protein YoaK (UPF0700 family)
MREPTSLDKSAIVVSLVLTLVAGYVDAVGFLRLGGIYVANMSGNSVSVGIHSALGPVSTVLQRLLPIGSYVIGLLFARIFADLAARKHLRRTVAFGIGAEIAFLIFFMTAAGLNAGVFFAAVAMGIQVATLLRFNGVNVFTGFVTGSLVKFADNFADAVLGSSRHRNRSQAARDAAWFAATWFVYVAGAIVGAAAFHRKGVSAVAFACLILAGIALVDLIRPDTFAHMD